MSLIANNCHGFKAAGISGWPASPDKVWALGWFKVDSTTGGSYRTIVQVSDDVTDATHDYFGLSVSGSNVVISQVRTANQNLATPDSGTFYLWNGDNQNKWMVGCAIIDRTTSSADLKCIYGRAAATAVAATTQTDTGDVSAFTDQLVDIYVAADYRKVKDGSGTSNDDSDGMKVAYIAIGHGSVPTQANIQSVIDGMHPADLPGVWEYWDLTSSSAGLVGALQGITLAPYGGSATTTWDGADNPTVNAPTGGSVDGSATGATLTGTSSLTAGSATGTAEGTANGATLTGTSSLTAGSATGNATGSFTTAAMENNTGSGLLANTAVEWTLYYGTIGSAPSGMAHGSGTTNASGVLSGSGAPLGDADLWVRTPDGVGIYYQRLTVA